jgi:hypothetical protein
LLAADLAPSRIDAGEALELLPPIGLRDLPRWRAGKDLPAKRKGLLVAVGQQPVVANPHEAIGKVAAVGGDLHALCEQLRARQAAAGRIPIRHAPRPPRSETGQTA